MMPSNLLSNIQDFDRAIAVKAVMVASTSEGKVTDRGFRGGEEWREVLISSIDLAMKCKMHGDGIRLVLSKTTVVVQREETEYAAVVVPTGDPFGKSLRRFIRRTARRKSQPTI